MIVKNRRAAAFAKTAATEKKPLRAKRKAPAAKQNPPNALGQERSKQKTPTGKPVQLTPSDSQSVRATYRKLVAAHPDAHCELDHRSPFELIVATVLSAQSTDVQVNKVTPELFRAFPTPRDLAQASQTDVEACINRLGMFRQKAKNLIGLAQALVGEHGGEVPADQAKLVKLPGVGRKTANVVLGVAFQKPAGVVVDTHVQRITQRLGWTTHATPEKIEQDLMRLLPRSEWDRVSHTLIFHGRRICAARKPACSTCPVNKNCASAFAAEEVGRKPKKAPRNG
jgi:endonuclease III